MKLKKLTATILAKSNLYDRKESRTGNSGFKKLAVQWLQEVQFSNRTFVVTDSLVLRNRQLLKPTKRYVQPMTMSRPEIG